jgi:hypothetical protein
MLERGNGYYLKKTEKRYENEVDCLNKALAEVVTMLAKAKMAQGLYESEVTVG